MVIFQRWDLSPPHTPNVVEHKDWGCPCMSKEGMKMFVTDVIRLQEKAGRSVKLAQMARAGLDFIVRREWGLVEPWLEHSSNGSKGKSTRNFSVACLGVGLNGKEWWGLKAVPSKTSKMELSQSVFSGKSPNLDYKYGNVSFSLFN